MKLAIGFSTKDQVGLTRHTLLRVLRHDDFDLLWADGSRTSEGQSFFTRNAVGRTIAYPEVYGGADAAIAFKLSTALASSANYTHIGLLENDVLLDEDWYEPTIELFEKGKQDGLAVGAVSARSYVDRVLVQRDGYAVMHNVGAGMAIFTREAAEIVLRSFRTAWWPANRLIFAQLSGIDLATYAAFRGNDQWVTTDWGWEAQLASHGLATLALTPAKCQMIGQNPPLEQQGLHLTALNIVSGRWTGDSGKWDDPEVDFQRYVNVLDALRYDGARTDLPGIIHRDGAGMLFFPHQLGYFAGGPAWLGTLELQWNQGFGPFAYRAGPGGAILALHLSGSSSFLVSGGVAGARVAIKDTRSGFNFAPMLPPSHEPASLNVPGGPIPRRIVLEMDEGAVFYGVQTADPQMLDATFRFDWTQLPKAV